jgi:hypothetical protein
MLSSWKIQVSSLEKFPWRSAMVARSNTPVVASYGLSALPRHLSPRLTVVRGGMADPGGLCTPVEVVVNPDRPPSDMLPRKVWLTDRRKERRQRQT